MDCRLYHKMKSIELTGKGVGKILCDLVFGDGFINTPMVLPMTEKKIK